MKKNHLHVGKVKQAHSLRGEVYILIFSKDISWLKKIKNILLVNHSQEKIVSVIKTKPFKDGFIATLDAVTDRNMSEALEGYEVWIPADLLKSMPNETPYLIEIQNFKVVDKTLGDIGIIREFSSNGQQDLLIIQSKSNIDFEVPFVDDFVLKIDSENKTIFTDLPEGLIELNLKAEKPDDGLQDHLAHDTDAASDEPE